MRQFWIIGFAFCVLLAGLSAYAAATLFLRDEISVQESLEPKPSAPLFPEEAARIIPHKALYKIEMVQRNSAAQVLNIFGEMYFEWRPVCGAWTTNHRFNLVYEYAENPQTRIASDFTTYELVNGEGFDFNSRRRRDGEIYEELRGHADMPAGPAAGEASYTLPGGTKFDLPPGTLFPMAHTLALLKAVREGKAFFKAAIFDGSDEEGPVEVNAFIGPVVNPLSRIVDITSIDRSMLDSPGRSIRLAFFPLSNLDPDSDYEMDMVLHDNGVISDMRVDYKEFSVTQKLIGLEKLSGEGCVVKTASPGNLNTLK